MLGDVIEKFAFDPERPAGQRDFDRAVPANVFDAVGLAWARDDDAAGGIVPFRGWVRKLSGAERHARDVAAAIGAGAVRRAFLKGIAGQRGCKLSAEPR